MATVALLVVTVMPAFTAPPKEYYQLTQRTQEFTRALAAGNSWQIYHMFVPQFRQENSFLRFDSALTIWYAGRRIGRARSMLVEIQGLGGHASTWPVFEGEDDYSYVYQNWFYTPDGWHLVWLSNILDQSFQYGQGDTAAIEAVGRAALDHITTASGLAELRRGLVLPDTLAVLWSWRTPAEPFRVPGRPVVMLRPNRAGKPDSVPHVAYYFRFSSIRLLGDFATCAVDLVPTRYNRFATLKRTHGALLYFERRDTGWQFNSVGKKW